MLSGNGRRVADISEEWVNEADCNSFNIVSIVNPWSWEGVVELLVPLLVMRGADGSRL
jgi:hypothetical protein